MAVWRRDLDPAAARRYSWKLPFSRISPRVRRTPIATPEAAVSYKLSLDALSVESFETGSHEASAVTDGTAGRDCTGFPVCPRTDTTDAV
jgi:hypothetical protein